MNIFPGKKFGRERSNRIKEALVKHGFSPRLDIITIDKTDEIDSYIRQKRKMAQETGITVEIHEFQKDTDETEVLTLIDRLNHDDQVNGFFIQFPVPETFAEQILCNAIDPRKDVDGLHATNLGKLLKGDHSGFAPATPLAIISILNEVAAVEREDAETWIQGKSVVIINHSNIVGKPLAAMLINMNASVSVVHKYTPDLRVFTQNADIVISATGNAHSITDKHIKQGAVVIDAGIEVKNGIIQGDIDAESMTKASWITPVPGGVGPMTVVSLLENVVKATLLQQGKNYEAF